jgi:hypothetical protein
MSSSLAVFAACQYFNMHQPLTAPAPLPRDTIFAGQALDVSNRRQNVSMAAFITALSGHF